MFVGKVPVVAVAVPIMSEGRPLAILVAYYRADTSREEIYTQQLWSSRVGSGFILDSTGTVVTSSVLSRVGTRIDPNELKGRDHGMVQFSTAGRGDMVAGFWPMGIGGWKVGVEYRASDLYSAINHRGLWVTLALALLLIFTVPALVFLHLRRRQLEARLRFEAMHDPLTKAANRSLFWDRLEQAQARRRRTGEPIALLYLDLDNFKGVNDSKGHSVGDALLKEIATRLHDGVRASDTVARVGGDEFAVLLDGMPELEAELTAQRLVDSIACPIYVGADTIATHASVGIALDDDGSIEAEEFVRRADAAMYSAKVRGSRIEVFHQLAS
jgi:diguanylate cyclase (GGDEF)-like protein